MMAAILLAAGAFTGIMKGTGMLTAMAQAAVGVVPPGLASHIPVVLGVLSMPLSLLFDPDSFYLGVLPVVAEVAGTLGVPPIAGRAGGAARPDDDRVSREPADAGDVPARRPVPASSSPSISASPSKYLFAASLVMTTAAVLFGVFPL